MSSMLSNYSRNHIIVWCYGTVILSLGLLLVCPIRICRGDDVQNTTVPTDENLSSAIEEKVLGPLRIWHIVFIVSFFLLIALVAVFCCVEIRVPRSRQEIEDNYQKRLMNLKYVQMLEKAPEELLRTEFPKPEISVIASKETKSPTGRQPKQQQPSATRGWQQAKQGAMSNNKASSSVQDSNAGQGLSMISSKLAKTAAKAGGPQPLAINPRDILAIMAQQRKTKNEE